MYLIYLLIFKQILVVHSYNINFYKTVEFVDHTTTNKILIQL